MGQSMISDVLSEAVDDIRAYLRSSPHVYANVRAELDELVTDMDAIREHLDCAPEHTGQPIPPRES